MTTPIKDRPTDSLTDEIVFRGAIVSLRDYWQNGRFVTDPHLRDEYRDVAREWLALAADRLAVPQQENREDWYAENTYSDGYHRTTQQEEQR